MPVDDLRRSPMMSHLLDALEQGQDIGHYGRLTFAMVAHHFLNQDELVEWLAKDGDTDERRARALVQQVEERDHPELGTGAGPAPAVGRRPPKSARVLGRVGHVQGRAVDGHQPRPAQERAHRPRRRDRAGHRPIATTRVTTSGVGTRRSRNASSSVR